MSLDRDWDTIRPDRRSNAARAGMGLLRITLLFGSAAAALALIATPVLERQSRPKYPAGVDMTSTGSIARGDNTYTLRRSVLQSSPGSVCLIRADGRRSGDC